MRVDRLPGGWLGKNHALYRGAGAAAVTLARGGIEWRSTFYPLDLLRDAP